MTISGPRITGLLILSAALVAGIGAGVHWMAEVEVPPRDHREPIRSEAASAPRSAEATSFSLESGHENDDDPSSESSPPKAPQALPEPRISKGGPLADAGWSYAWCALNKEDPDRTFVLLRRDGDGSARVPGSSRPAELTFWLEDTRIRSEKYGLDFVVVSADARSLVYFEPSYPQMHYALVRKTRSLFQPRSD